MLNGCEFVLLLLLLLLLLFCIKEYKLIRNKWKKSTI